MRSFLNKCVLYGAGANAYGMIKYIGEDRVVRVIDSYPNRMGEIIDGCQVINLANYFDKYRDLPIVISATYKSQEIINTLKKHDFSNYLVGLNLQTNVTEISALVDEILKYSKSKKIVFDQTNNVMAVLIIDELISRGLYDTIHGCIGADNFEVKEYYDLKMVDDLTDNCYLVVTQESVSEKSLNFSTQFKVNDFMYRNPAYRNEELTKFKGLHKGKRCFVIGNGPSLRIADLETLQKKHEICFASNGIFCAYDKTIWRPDYYVISDFIRYKDSYNIIKEFSASGVFVRSFYNMLDMEYAPGTNIFNAIVKRDEIEFSMDLAEGIFSGGTVTYHMLQIAAYMGFEKIYLLGVDFSFDKLSGAGSNHFDPKYEEQFSVKDIFYHDENLLAYQMAENFSRKNGFRIYNATRGGKLEVFERVNFDKLMGV